MIGKRGKILAAFYMIFLVVLFLMCSTDLIIREPEKEIYQIAVIVEDADDDNYVNFRKGMDQAAVEFNADVRFITLYEEMDARQQLDMIDRERQDGADALIVVPVDEKVLAAALEKQGNVPMVLLGSGELGERTEAVAVVDYRRMGEQLAEEMKKRVPVDCTVLILAEPHERSTAAENFLQGAEAELEKGGYACRRVRPEGKEGYWEMLKALPEGEAVLLAGTPEVLSEAGEVLEEDPVLADGVQGLFGRGSTMAVFHDLDSGIVTGICITDEFSRGYFSVRMAIEALEGKGGQESLIMESYYIEKKDMRKPEYEKMLFPME